ncbi:hypothetical protein M422DRAFT_260852 [Sphaerobolus stellatus SS14]|uniref:F-box domain-containing protein n=1 Tax=Sphaerobolus stellatus (strain SS14) TaxID=990650 RepID=A0A0C9UPR5_SPHS4|nr:hypothetical protein M422DRAFT_260852 [Sphaerobolus stellatus SS14]
MASRREGELNKLVDLPPDILFCVCSWLSVRDILSLRQVNKPLYFATKEPTVWFSLLRRLRLILPPAQPLLPNSYVFNTYWSLEYTISRSLRLHHKWTKSYNPPAHCYAFNAHYRVHTIRFLPGGNHMVTVCKCPDSMGENIVVWDMTFGGGRNHVAIAMLHSHTAVGKIQTRYGTVDGRISLVIAFVRPPVQGRTAISVVSVPIRILNNLSRLGPGSEEFEAWTKDVQNPFVKLLEKETRYATA